MSKICDHEHPSGRAYPLGRTVLPLTRIEAVLRPYARFCKVCWKDGYSPAAVTVADRKSRE
jgi:hypothetical protein